MYSPVEWFVQWGLDHRELRQVESIGADELHRSHGLRTDSFLTVICQVDAHGRRLLWVGKRRSGDDPATRAEGARARGAKKSPLRL